MLGTLDPSRKEVTIVGAGIAGLLLAYRLDRQGWQVTLVEGSERVGGLIRTTRSPDGIAESAAHSVLASDPVRELFQELRVRLLPARESSRYVLRGGKLRSFPLSPAEATGAFMRAYFKLADRSRKPSELTLEEWAKRHLGSRALEYLLTPFVRGIYGAEPRELLVGAAFPALEIEWGHSLVSQQLRHWRKRREKKAKRAMMAPSGGMSELVTALESRLKEKLGARFRLKTPVATLPTGPNVALCVPAHEAARLLAPSDPELSSALEKVRYSPLVSITVFVARARVPSGIRGVGVLVPPSEKRDCLGILFNSSAFAERVADARDIESFTVMLGGTSRPELLALGDAELRLIVEKELSAVLGIGQGVRDLFIHRWPNAVPLYDASLVSAWQRAREGWCGKAGRLLFGNFTGQVSLRGMIETVATLE
jgi:protoporphyrinogen/coproporphyrinogen III oxidase